MESFSVNIIGLSNNVHQFGFELGDEFFKQFGQDLLDKGIFKAKITLDKRETLIQADFRIEGTARLICDRSLEPFDYPMTLENQIMFKYGQEKKEISEDMVMITHETEKLDMGQYMYEFISLGIPMKKLHPKFQGEESDQDSMIYRSDQEEKPDIDPRWEALKKLNKKN